ncbi:putative phosphate transport protein (TIGR00153 family) [Clostridiales Family XIII bacterium PM5-7]
MNNKETKKKKKRSFFKKKERPNFYSMLRKQCEITSKSVSLLQKYIGSKDANVAEEIEQCEKKADKVRRNLIDYVETSFITPLDRHDIFAMSRRIDDMTDKIKDLKDFLVLFAYEPTEKNVEMIRLIGESIHAITDAVSEWEDGSLENFWEHLVRAKKCDDQVKRLYWEDIDDLDKEVRTLKEIIILREFSKDLNTLANKVGRAADIIGDTKIKSIK